LKLNGSNIMPMSVITVAGINPILNILGATQQFNYTQPLSLLQVNNNYIPTALVSSQFNMEYRNNLLSGFRWIHLTNNTDTHGSLTLQSFVNAQSSGINIMTFTESGNINIASPVNMSSGLDLGSNKITNLADAVGPNDAVNFGQLNLILVQSVSGTATRISSTGGQNPVIDLVNTAVTPGSYTYSAITVDAAGRLTAASSGVAPVLSVAGTSTRINSTGGTTPVIDLVNTAVTPGTYSNTTLTVDAAGRLTAASSNPVGIQASLYMSGNATGTAVAANTFTKVAGTTTSSSSNVNFTNTDNRSTYTGVTTINTIVTANISVSHAILVGGATLGVSIYKNGVTQLSAGNYELQPTQNAITSLSISGVYAQLATNDYVEVFVSADGATTVLVTDMNLSVSI
jgi:hypothetical protein